MVRKNLTEISIIFMGFVLLVLVLQTLKTFLRPLAMAMILTMLIYPLVNFSKKCKVPVFLTFIVLAISLVTAAYFFTALAINAGSELEAKFPTYQAQITNTIDEVNAFIPDADVKLSIQNYFSFQKVGSYITLLIQKAGSLISELFIILLFTIFLVPSYKKLITGLENYLTKSELRKFRHVVGQTQVSIQSYLVVKTGVSLGTALLSAIIFALFGVDFIFVLSVLVFFLNFIPNIGSVIATGLAGIIFILKFGIGFNFIWFLVLLILIQIIFGNFVDPLFSGERLSISPIVILISLFFWYWVWGLGGMILAVPLTSIFKIILENIDSTKHVAKIFG